MRDTFGTFFDDEPFADLFPSRGQPAETPWQLALVTIFPFVEDLSDRQAAGAVRSRLDWKYALSLELTDPGFDVSVLCQFRHRLLEGKAKEKLLQVLLETFTQKGLLKAVGRQRTDSARVLAAVRTLNRLEKIGQTLVAALESLAVVAPDWLVSVTPADWFLSYARRVENFRLPREQKERQAWAAQVGHDGSALLAAVDAAEELPYLKEIPAVRTLRQVWAEQFGAGSDGPPHFKAASELPPASGQLVSAYDTEARFATKREIRRVGNRVHLTQTCDAEAPHLLVHVETTPATTPDENLLELIHPKLTGKGLLPGEHLVDAGYTDAGVLAKSLSEFGVDVIGPVEPLLAGTRGRQLRQKPVCGGLGAKGSDVSGGQESLCWYDDVTT